MTNVFNSDYSLEKWAEQLSALSDSALPLVHSVSYGNDEAQQSGVAYMAAVNLQLVKLGVRGVSILFASGDQASPMPQIPQMSHSFVPCVTPHVFLDIVPFFFSI